MLQLSVCVGQISISLLRQCCVYTLLGFRHKNNLVRVRKISWFRLKIPVLVVTITDGDVANKNSQKCP